MKYAIIGMGMIYKFISQAIERLPQQQIIAVCDTDISKRHDTPYPFFTDYNQMCDSAIFDYIIVLVPNDKKNHIISALLQKSQDYRLIIEKPIATNFTSFADFEPFLKSGQLTTIYHRTYNDQYILFKDFIHKNKDIIDKINITYYENITEHTTHQNILCLPDKDGGGCIWDNLPNCLDLLLSVFSEVTYSGYSLLEKNAFDSSVAAVLHYVCDTIDCTIHLSWKYPGEQKKLHVSTKDGITNDFDLIDGYTPPKKSLISEYMKIFTNFVNGLEHDNYERTRCNMKMLLEATAE